MITKKIICNRCGSGCNGGSYSLSPTVSGKAAAIDIIAGINMRWEKHYCGKQCLMLALNEMLDGLEGQGLEAGGRGLDKPQDTEDCYEDHIAA